MPRFSIVNDFSEWCAFSSTRSGSPLKSRKDVYPLIKIPDYKDVLEGNEITINEFNLWHKKQAIKINNQQPKMPIGWSVKLINVYLKSMAYVGNYGREGIREVLHPPIDNGLWDGIAKYCKEHQHTDIMKETHLVGKIKDIDTYEKYQTIINGCCKLSKHMGCSLIEIEQLWEGMQFNTK
jgi:hypothetical protein